MDSLANYGSDGENSDNSEDSKMTKEEKCVGDRRASDANYDPVQMDMSEDSNNNNSSGDSENERHSPPATTKTSATHQTSSATKSDGPRTSRTSPSDQRRSDHESPKGDSRKSDKGERTRNSDEKSRRSSIEDKRHRDPDTKDSKKTRDDDKKKDEDRRRDRNSSSSGREERKEEREKDHHHRDDKRDRRDRDRRHSRTDRTKDRHRNERSSHPKDKDRARSRSRSKDRSNSSFRPMSYREEKGRNKLAQLEKLGIELKAPEGGASSMSAFGEQNFYNPLATASHGKYAEQIQKRKLLWANKSKPDEGTKNVGVASTTNTWVGTTFTHDQDGKMTAKFKRLMGIKGEQPTTPTPGLKPDILKKQEEMFNNMEQQYEVARATTHTQRGVGLGYASSGYQFPR